MVERFRTMADSLVLRIIFVIIILSFIFTGLEGSLVGGMREYAAKVNGQKISIQAFEQNVQSERNQLQQQLGEKFSALVENQDYLKRMRMQVLDRMVDDLLLEQYAQKLGLVVSDDTIKQNILTSSYFQTEGKFDNPKYLDLIARMGLTPDGYAQYMRQQLIRQQLLQGYMASDFTLPMELQQLSALIMQSREVRLALINIKALESKQSVDDKELQAYYQQNKIQFVEPERVKVSYIELDAANFADRVNITPDDISAYYEQHKENFSQPELRKYRIIQLKTEDDAKAVLKQLKDGANFGTLVKEKSIDIISRKTDGYTDWMEKNTTPEALIQANLAEKGQLSSVIKSGETYLIANLAEIKPEQAKPLSEVSQEIAANLKQERALDAYYAQQQKLSEGASGDNQSLAMAEQAVGLKAKETDWFSRENVPEVLNSPTLIDTIFSGKLYDDKGNALGNSDVITVDGDRAFVVRVVAHQAEQTKPFADVRDNVINLVRRGKAEKAARAEGEKLLAALKANKGTEALKSAGIAFTDKQTLTRQSDDRQLVDVVFALPHPAKDAVNYGMTQDNDNIVLVALDAVRPGVLADTEKSKFSDEILKSANGIIFDSLMANLRKQGKIEIGKVISQY